MRARKLGSTRHQDVRVPLDVDPLGISNLRKGSNGAGLT